MSENNKKCPFCAEDIPADAIECPFCKSKQATKSQKIEIYKKSISFLKECKNKVLMKNELLLNHFCNEDAVKRKKFQIAEGAIVAGILVLLLFSCIISGGYSPQSPAEKNALTAAKRLIKNGNEIGLRYSIAEAITNNYLCVAEYCIKNGVPIPEDSFYESAASGDTEMVKLLLKNGAKEKDRALFAACKAGQFQTAELLLDYGAVPCMANSNGNTCLWYAIDKNDLNLAKKMIKAGALKYEDKYSLHLACSNVNVPATKLLIDNGMSAREVSIANILKSIDVLKKSPVDNDSVIKIIQLLAKGGANVNSALPTAVRSGNEELVKCLVKLGADPHQKENGFPMTSLTINRKILKFLLSKNVVPLTETGSEKDLPKQRLNPNSIVAGSGDVIADQESDQIVGGVLLPRKGETVAAYQQRYQTVMVRARKIGIKAQSYLAGNSKSRVYAARRNARVKGNKPAGIMLGGENAATEEREIAAAQKISAMKDFNQNEDAKKALMNNDKRLMQIPYDKISDDEALAWVELLYQCGARAKFEQEPWGERYHTRVVDSHGRVEDLNHWQKQQMLKKFARNADYMAAKNGFSKTVLFLIQHNLITSFQATLEAALDNKHYDLAIFLLSTQAANFESKYLVGIMNLDMLKCYITHGGKIDHTMVFCLKNNAFMPRNKTLEDLLINAVTSSDFDEIQKLLMNHEFSVACRLLPKAQKGSGWRWIAEMMECNIPNSNLTLQQRGKFAAIMMEYGLYEWKWTDIAEQVKDLKHPRASFWNAVIPYLSLDCKSKLLGGAVAVNNYDLAYELLDQGADPSFPSPIVLDRIESYSCAMDLVKNIADKHMFKKEDLANLHKIRRVMETKDTLCRMQDNSANARKNPSEAKKIAMTLFQKGDFKGVVKQIGCLSDSKDTEIQAILGISFVLTNINVSAGLTLMESAASSGNKLAAKYWYAIYSDGFGSIKADQAKSVQFLTPEEREKLLNVQMKK